MPVVDETGNIFDREPVLFLGVVQAVIVLAVSFGLALNTAQAGSIELVTLAILSLIARRKVTPA